MSRMTTGVGAFESPDVGGPSRYLEHMFSRTNNLNYKYQSWDPISMLS